MIMEFNGCSVFVNCGNFGVFQGKVSEVDAQAKTVTLINVMKNGEFVSGSHILNSAEILDIKVLKMGTPRDRGEIPQRQSKTVAINGKMAKKALNDAEAKQPPKPQMIEKKVVLKEMKQADKPDTATHKAEASGSGNSIIDKLLLPPIQSLNLNKDTETKHNEKKTLKEKEKHKENKKPISSPAIPTSAIKILKRGEPLPQGPAHDRIGKQEEKAISDKTKQTEVSITVAESKKQKNKARKSKKSESDKSTSEQISESQSSKTDTQSSRNAETKKSVKNDTEGSLIVETTSVSSTNPVVAVPVGLRVDPLSLISAVAAPSSILVSSAKSSPRKHVPERSLSVNDQPFNKPHFEKFGEFKRFTEKQAPVPCNFNAGNHRSRGNTSSPSGVPQKDFSNGYGKVHHKNKELDAAIDYDAFKNDFDFDANLALFVREEDEECEDTDVLEAPADIRNYRNDENILGDPNRVTSWTGTIHEFRHSAIFDGKDGLKIPVLGLPEKKKFLNVVAKSLGADILNFSIADHIFSVILNVISTHSLNIENIVLLGSNNTNSSLINRLAMHLSNRKYHSYFVDCSCRLPLPFIEFVDENQIRQLFKNIQIVVNLEPTLKEVLEIVWLSRFAYGDNSAHVISLENDLPQYPNSHSLYLGTLVEHPPKQGKYLPQRFVADLAIPFTWFNDEACDALSKSFSKSTIISI